MVIPLNRGASGEGECLCLVFLVITLSAIQSRPSISICARIMCVCWHSCAYCPGVTTVDSTYICIAMFLCGIIIRSCYGHRQHNHRHRTDVLCVCGVAAHPKHRMWCNWRTICDMHAGKNVSSERVFGVSVCVYVLWCTYTFLWYSIYARAMWLYPNRQYLFISCVFFWCNRNL